jgi:hypothetical protein
MYSELIEITSGINHILSFDLKVISGNLDPWVALSLYADPSRSQLIQTSGPSVGFGLEGVFPEIVSASNGFSTYTFSIPALKSQNNQNPLPAKMFYEMTFHSSFYQSQQGSIYVDNIAFAPIPEPSGLLLIGSSAIGAMLRRKRIRS